MKIQPIGQRVLIKPVAQETKTAGGIYLPESDNEKKEGTVVEVGHDKTGKKLPLKKGDVILYGGYSNEDFEVGDERFIIVDYKDVLARIQK